MKVALLVHCFYPNHVYGTEAYTLLVAQNLQKLGWEPTVVSTIFMGEKAQERPIETYVWEGVKVVSIDKNAFPHEGLAETFNQPSMRVVHERVLRGINPDIIHVTHLINHTVSIMEVASAMNIPLTFTLTDFFGFCYNNKLESADEGLCSGPSTSRRNCVECYLKDMANSGWASPAMQQHQKRSARRWTSGKAVVRRALGKPVDKDIGAIMERPDLMASRYENITAAIAPSSFLKEAYESNMPQLPLRLSHFGIDIDRSPKPARKQDEPLVYGFVGQIAPHKGVHLLVEAFSKLPSGSALHIYGNTDQNPAYFSRLKRMSAGLNVVFKGTYATSEAHQVLGSLDVMIIPSTWYENSPLILLQALATHTPCVVSDVRGMTEFVRDGVNGFHFRRGNSLDLFEKMSWFMAEPNRAADMSLTTHYERTALGMAKDVAAMYEDVLAQEIAETSTGHLAVV